MLVKELPKCLTSRVCYALYHGVQRHLRSTDGPHAVMYSSWSEAPLNDLPKVSGGREDTTRGTDLESSAPAKYQVAQGHADVVIDDF